MVGRTVRMDIAHILTEEPTILDAANKTSKVTYDAAQRTHNKKHDTDTYTDAYYQPENQKITYDRIRRGLKGLRIG